MHSCSEKSVWLWQDGRRPFLYIQKCGSSAIGSQVPGLGHTMPLKDYEGPLSVMWRNPKDRMESAYRMFYDRREMAVTRNLPDMDLGFTQWVHEVLQQPDADRDLHVATMTAQATRGGVFKPTVVYRWDFAQVAADYGVSVIDTRNPSDHRIPTVWGPGLLDAHREAYAADWQRWAA